MKIVWLCSWYPNKLKPFDGDFIQRHAEAVSLLHEIHVVHVVKDTDRRMQKKTITQTVVRGNLSETIIYYQARTSGIRWVNKIFSELKLQSLYKSAIKLIMAGNKIDLFHVHVALKAGTIGLWIWRKFGIPYILSEHWTGYLSEATPNFNDLPKMNRLLIRRVFSQAKHITFVSQYLASAAMNKLIVMDYSIVPNVVNTAIFNPLPVKPFNNITRFIHVSTLTTQKNIEAILDACRILKKDMPDFQLDLFVPAVQHLHDLILQYQLEDHITIHPEVPQLILAKTIKLADALILYSKYETFGCVVIEANACGLPAILSDLPVFHEYCIEGKTALFAELGKPLFLANTMKAFILNKQNFHPAEIAEYTSGRFNYQVVARQFDEIYNKIFKLHYS